jgi:hypothetical protein
MINAGARPLVQQDHYPSRCSLLAGKPCLLGLAKAVGILRQSGDLLGPGNLRRP